jgi:hypothetical protein
MMRFLNSIVGLSMACLAALSLPAQAGGSVPLPVIEKGQGDKCVEPVEFMRRNHMELLKHQRDETMYRGIRTRKYSLQECIECHASQKNGAVVGSNENFCQSCHSYTATHLDCWDCHATKPKAAKTMPPAASVLMGSGGMQ